MLSTIAIESLKRRKTTALLTLLSITISISLLLCVDIVRSQVKTSFTRTVFCGLTTDILFLHQLVLLRVGQNFSGIFLVSASKI